jgi:outer membrane protein OmpA-like peptidoglycan-associated protein
MNKGIYILFFFIFNWLSAQDKLSESFYFEFDKFDLNQSQISRLNALSNIPISDFNTIQLYGYCDDRGNDDYNNRLSIKRVTTVQKILLANGIPQNKIFICEGKGRVIIEKDSVKNLEKTRDKNRRVDLIFIKNISRSSFSTTSKVGDLIVLEKVVFDLGSSVLSLKAKKELDKIIPMLEKHKSLRFEIKGHVCCTSNKYLDAIDNETDERNLSINRAKRVFSYLRTKGINPYRMTFKGYGNRFPLGKGDDFDRRVELQIIKL